MAGSVGQPTQTWFPWVASKTNTGWNIQSVSATSLGMGFLGTINNAQNNAWAVDLYMDSVVWKIPAVYGTAASFGIHNFQLNGSTVGLIDSYDPGNTTNHYAEATGIVVATAGVQTFQDIMATKNASSSGYGAWIQSIALIATSGAYSTPSGTDTPGYTWEWFPWMGDKAHTNFTIRAQSSAKLGGGALQGAGVQNDAFSADAWLDSGTFTVAAIGDSNATYGISSHQLDGSTVATVDWYPFVAGSSNNYAQVTGVVIATAGVKTYQNIMATKNASSTGYYGVINSVKWVRTGA